ncbi:hypothetical protein TNCV_4939011 [Trichonephila clavipes]|nr:hypothetical protein TNCV_4939011 [Trichonephila clavipes]
MEAALTLWKRSTSLDSVILQYYPDETVSSKDEGDLEPLRKLCKPLSDSDND